MTKAMEKATEIVDSRKKENQIIAKLFNVIIEDPRFKSNWQYKRAEKHLAALSDLVNNI